MVANKVQFAVTGLSLDIVVLAPFISNPVAGIPVVLGGNDTITGSSGIDILGGHNGKRPATADRQGGNDTLLGGSGNDILEGGLGKDTETGGAGNDTFRYIAANQSVVGANADIFTDFDKVGNDVINLRHCLELHLSRDRRVQPRQSGPHQGHRGPRPSRPGQHRRLAAPDMEIRLKATAVASMTQLDFLLDARQGACVAEILRCRQFVPPGTFT